MKPIAIIMAVIAGLICLYIFWVVLVNAVYTRCVKRALANSDELYFYGFRLSRFILGGAFIRLEKWLGYSMCYELSILAMFTLEDYRSARLCRGTFRYTEGNTTRHSWVEVWFPLQGWVVFDYAWLGHGFCPKRKYFTELNKRGEIKTEWVCSYDEFWKIGYNDLVLDAMSRPETSYILPSLSPYGSPTGSRGFDFYDWIYRADSLIQPDPGKMFSYYHKNDENNQPFSSEIIQDFVKREARKQPKAKTIRLARKEIRPVEYNVAS